MNRLLRSFGAAFGVGCLVACATASAGWHGHVGVWIGPALVVGAARIPVLHPYYYPPVVVADPVYVQPNRSFQVPAPPNYWYYCRQSNAYYPYASQCPSGWEQVSPQLPRRRRRRHPLRAIAAARARSTRARAGRLGPSPAPPVAGRPGLRLARSPA